MRHQFVGRYHATEGCYHQEGCYIFQNPIRRALSCYGGMLPKGEMLHIAKSNSYGAITLRRDATIGRDATKYHVTEGCYHREGCFAEGRYHREGSIKMNSR